MGGDFYGRDDNYTSQHFASSIENSKAKIHPNLDPKNWSASEISTFSRSPIVFGLDVTGSMGEWVKII